MDSVRATTWNEHHIDELLGFGKSAWANLDSTLICGLE